MNKCWGVGLGLRTDGLKVGHSLEYCYVAVCRRTSIKVAGGGGYYGAFEEEAGDDDDDEEEEEEEVVEDLG